MTPINSAVVSSGLAWIQQGSHVQLKIDHGRNTFINPVLWGNNESTGGGKIQRDHDSQGLLINALFNCLCTQSASLLHGLHLCHVQRDDEKVAFFSNACYYVTETVCEDSVSVSLCYPFPLSLSFWRIFMTCPLNNLWAFLYALSSFCSSLSPPLLFYPSSLCFHLHCVVVIVFSQQVISYCSPHRDHWDDGRIVLS